MVDSSFGVANSRDLPSFDTGLSRRLPTPGEQGSDPVSRALALLQAYTGQDFSQYKKSTVEHAIDGRMAACGIEKTLAYADFTQSHPEESKALYKDLLTQVTGFFRDPEAFEVLRRQLLPALVERPPECAFRVWVPGCSSGEEVYSLAILLQELVDQTGGTHSFSIFGNDLDYASIRVARSGLYPTSMAEDVSPARLARFFTSQQDGYQVNEELCKSVKFATLNVATHPPWNGLDLISCRNLMIYLKPAFQNVLLGEFHKALRPGGLLLLSPSESITYEAHQFTTVSREWKLYQSFAPGLASVFPSQATSQTHSSGVTREGGRR